MTVFDSKGTRNVVRSTSVVVNVLVYVSLRPRSTGGGWLGGGGGRREGNRYVSILFSAFIF